LGIGLEFSQLRNDNLSSHRTLRQDVVNWFPSASLHLDLPAEQTLSAGYSGNTIQPGITQLQPVNDLTNPLIILSGNPDLKPSFMHQANIEFRKIDLETRRSFQIAVNGTYTERKIVSSTAYGDGGVQTQRWINASGDWNISGNAAYGFSFG